MRTCARRACCDKRHNLRETRLFRLSFSFFTRAIRIEVFVRHNLRNGAQEINGDTERKEQTCLSNCGNDRVQKVHSQLHPSGNAPSVRSRSKKNCRDVILRISCLSRSMSAHRIILTPRMSFLMAGCEARKVTQLRTVDESRFSEVPQMLRVLLYGELL